jgi:multidrug efflux pump subunit AcrA (membrane-fusion protein)
MNANDDPRPAGTAATGASPAKSPVPPRGPRVRRAVVLLALGALLFAAGHAFGGRALAPLARAWAALVPSAAPEGDPEQERTFYTCGMHPWVVLPGPGDCPVCHMRLTPLDPDKFSGEISIDPVVTQNIGVRVAPVVTGPLVHTLRTVGKVEYDETRLKDVNIRVVGWIEKLHVDYVGAEVAAGEPLFDLFSRELYSAQEEYLSAYRASLGEAPDVSFMPAVTDDLARNLEAARKRLLLFGIAPDEIARLEKQGEVSPTLAITSPFSGVVTEKHAFEGMRVDPGMLTYRIADLSRVWVIATVYEHQLPYLSVGQSASIALPYLPGARFDAQVTYVYPWLEEKAREVRVRLELDNADGLFKPGMFATVELSGRLADERTLAPREAILDTGERTVAFVSLGAGRFEPRDVRLGASADGGLVEVLQGLLPGEMVVTSGQFLLDSEARIREGLSKMIRGDQAADQTRSVAVAAGGVELASLPKDVEGELVALLASYFAAGDALAGDRLDGVAAPARKVAAAVDELLQRPIPGDEHFWHRHTEVAAVRGGALALARAPDLEAARLAFADTSVALSTLVRATGVPRALGADVHELRCPMFREDQGGGLWLQTAGAVRNPFMGTIMLECHDRELALPAAGAAEDAR